MMRRLVVWFAVCWVAWGCGVTEPPEIGGEVLRQIPEEYRAWWTETEACSGLTGRFNAIQWYVLPGDRFAINDAGHMVAGAQYGQTIWLSEANLQNKRVVRHEMLHALIHYVPGMPDHPPIFEVCGLRSH